MRLIVPIVELNRIVVVVVVVVVLAIQTLLDAFYAIVLEIVPSSS